MLTIQQAWQAMVSGKISAQNGGVSVDTSDLQEDQTPSQKAEPAESATEKSASNPFSSETLGILHANPNPEILPDENSITDDERIFSALSYFPFISFFVIATRKDSLFITYHAWQGFTFFVLFVVSLPIYWLLGIIPGMGLLFWFFYCSLFIAGFYASFMAWSGKYISFPMLSPFAQKLAGNKMSNI